MSADVVDAIEDQDQDPTNGSVTDLDRLLGDVENYEAPPVRVKHPLLDGYVMEFRSNLEFEEIEAWRKKAVTKKGRNGAPDEVDAAKASAMIVAGACTGIYLDGQPIRDSKGRTVTFTNPEFQIKLGCERNAANSARRFLLRDAAVGSVSSRVVEANGFGDDAEEAPDPTESNS